MSILTGNSGVSNAGVKNVPHRKKFALFFVIVLFSVVLVVIYFRGMLILENKRGGIYHNAFVSGILKNDPSPLQGLFLDDLRSGRNDKYTKSDAYFVTHRFFDNNGNIYEIYDYVNAHPELAFLKEDAEKIYPKVFAQISNKELPEHASDRSYYAYLAYVETLYKHGYTDIAAVATIANQYAKMAYHNTAIAKEMSKEDGYKRSRYAMRDAKKAVEFISYAENDAEKVLRGEITEQDVVPRDILVGMNQYGAALRYLAALHEEGQLSATATPPFALERSKKAFDFSMEYSRRKVPELTLFTALLNASTLVMFSLNAPAEVDSILFGWSDLGKISTELAPLSIITKVIDSRFEKKPVNIGETNMDIYGKRNIVRLSEKAPEFKKWLELNGWEESDFTL